jgi:hypothetical protein
VSEERPRLPNGAVATIAALISSALGADLARKVRGWQATRLKTEAGMINEVAGHYNSAGLTLLHVLCQCLNAARLTAFAGSDFQDNLDRSRDFVCCSCLSI